MFYFLSLQENLLLSLVILNYNVVLFTITKIIEKPNK